tara:strand:- start:456 stop:695 length:240 start_codon:yes stop_codon:yes gene_type:complete
MDLFQIIIGRSIFNYIGGTIRWIYSSIWRTIFNKPKLNYREYIDGPKNSKDHFDEFEPQFNNRLIGIGFLVGIVIILMN